MLNIKERLKLEAIKGTMENRNQIDFDNIRKDQIYYANLNGGVGSEQQGIRPVLVVSNNLQNKYSPTIIVATITSKMTKKPIPTHVFLDGYGLRQKSLLMLETPRYIDKTRLLSYIGRVDDEETKKEIDKAIKVCTIRDEEINKIKEEKKIIKKEVKPIDKLSEDMRKNINIMLKNIKANEIAYANSTNDNVRFHKMLLEERESWLNTLEKYCNSNSLNYKDYYEPYKKEELSIAI